MPRPLKIGLDYFPFDVDFFEDLKIRKLSRKHGAKGVTVAVYLLCVIYRNDGYFTKCDEDLFFVIADDLRIELEDVETIIKSLIKYDFFNKELAEKHQILTSKGIQRRFQEVSKRRKHKIKKEFLLLELDESEVNVTETSVNVAKTNLNEVNVDLSAESKVKKSKHKENIKQLAELYQENKLGIVNSKTHLAFERDIEKFSFQWCKEAMKELIKRNISNWNYATRILEGWEVKYGLNCKDPWRLEDESRVKKHNSANKKEHGKPTDWTDEPDELIFD